MFSSLRFSIIVALVLFAVPAVLYGLESHQAVDKWRWVEVMNPDGIDSGNNRFEFGGTCGIKAGNPAVTTKVHGDNVLVTYRVDGHSYGTHCPHGTIFFMPAEEFYGMTASHNDIQALEDEKKDLVMELLK